jgi:hypothetical protein
MPNARTGTVWWHRDHWDIRITLPNGKKSKPMHLDKSLQTKTRAEEIALHRTQLAANRGVEEDAGPGAPAVPGETFEEWTKRWLKERLARGPHHHGRRPRAAHEVGLPEARYQADGRRGAVNAFATVRKAFSDACHSKTLALRVLEMNPAQGVRGPDRGAPRRPRSTCCPAIS